MAADENQQKEENCEDFFGNMRDNMRQFCSMSLDDISEQDLEMAYPIQSELRRLNERYTNAQAIASGGIKEIFKVTDLKADQSLAMARLKKEAGRESTEAFLREARLTACLQHPNIISIYDLGFDEKGSPYFTMELLNGENLHDIIKNKSLPINRLLEVFNKVCDAVAYAHSRQIIHLDLKPDNIQVGQYGEVHLCDWGLAKILTDDDDMDIDEDLDPNILNHATINGRIKGSPGYMAPEQAIAYGEKDTRSDIYSLGAILYTLFCGQSPIQGETIDTLLEKTKLAKIIPVSDFPNVPKGIQAIITKCLSLKPADRYQTVQELQVDLDKYIHGFATVAEDAGFLTQLSLLVLRNKKTLSVITLIFLFISATIYTSFQKIKSERELAVEAKNKAEENFQLFIDEQQISKNLKNETSKLLHEISNSEDTSSAKRKINLLLEGLKREDNAAVRNAMQQKIALLYFIIQDFENALAIFQKSTSKGRYPHVKDACEWAVTQLRKKGSLRDTDIAQLLLKISYPDNIELLKSFYAKHMKFYRKPDSTPEEYLPIATVILHALNNFWDKDKMSSKLNYRQGSLKLPPKPYQTFYLKAYDLNIFSALELDELDISHTSFFEYYQIKDLKIKKLNIAGCKANSFSTQRLIILQKMGVTHLTYDSRYLTASEVALMQANFKTVDLAPSGKTSELP